MFYIIGDSHTQSFDNSIKKIWLGPKIAYQCGRRIQEIENELTKTNINKKEDILFFSFGEIDVRCHLGFIADKNQRSYKSVVEECVEKYKDFLDWFVERQYRVGVWGIIPSGKDNKKQGNGMSSYKTYKERNELTKLFNEGLEKVCLLRKIPFRCIFNLILADANFYDLYYSTDLIHLNAGMFKTWTNEKDCETIIKQELLR